MMITTAMLLLWIKMVIIHQKSNYCNLQLITCLLYEGYIIKASKQSYELDGY